MPHLQDIYQRLRSIPDASVDRAMAEALPTADAASVRLIAVSLLQRQHKAGRAALVRYYDQLPADIQAQIVLGAPTWDQPLREVAGYRLPLGPANVVRIIVAARAAHLAYLITEQLRHRPPELRVQASEGLLELARWATAASGDRSHAGCSPGAARQVQEAVQEAVGQYRTHQQPATLLALLVLAPRPMPEAIRQLNVVRDSEAVAALRRLLVAAQETDTRRAMLVMVQVPGLAKWVLQGISVACDGGHLPEVLSCWHLLLSQHVAHPLESAVDPQRLWPPRRQLGHWSSHATRGLARWAATLRLSDHERVHKLARLTLLHDAMSRLSALRYLIAMPASEGQDTQVQQAISRYCHDPEERLAWISLQHLIACRWSGLPALLPHLINSSHARVSQLARQHLAPLGFDRLWNGWRRMSLDQRMALGRAVVKIDPAFDSQLGSRLASASRLDKMRAMSIVRALNQGNRFEQALLNLTHDADVKVASTAVRTLGSVQSSPRVVEVLEASLHHGDSRVRANAIEALQELNSTRHVHAISAMAKHDRGRPRANAIRVLLQMNAGDALGALVNMLHDSKPDQRLSALWAVETMGLLELVRQVAEMSITDPDGPVKERADVVVHQLIGLMDADMDDPKSQPSASPA